LKVGFFAYHLEELRVPCTTGVTRTTVWEPLL